MQFLAPNLLWCRRRLRDEWSRFRLETWCVRMVHPPPAGTPEVNRGWQRQSQVATVRDSFCSKGGDHSSPSFSVRLSALWIFSSNTLEIPANRQAPDA